MNSLIFSIFFLASNALGKAINAQSEIELENRPIVSIIGGEEANKKQFTYQVALYINFEGGRSSFCSGTIISQKDILTAAHCVHSKETNVSIIFLQEKTVSSENIFQKIAKCGEAHVGINNLENSDDSHRQILIFDSKDIRLHSGWNNNPFVYDIALIFTKKINFNSYVQPIQLPYTSSDYIGKTATISGWGQSEIVYYSKELRFISLPVISNKECKDHTGSEIPPSIICFLKNSNKTTSFGDSGSPWTLEIKPENTIIVGVHSFNSAKILGASRISSFFVWIIKNCKSCDD